MTYLNAVINLILSCMRTIQHYQVIYSFSDINSNTNADSLINAEIRKVIEWLKINKLSLNKTKSKYMTFHMPKKEIQHLTLKIDGVNIEKVEEFIF